MPENPTAVTASRQLPGEPLPHPWPSPSARNIETIRRVRIKPNANPTGTGVVVQQTDYTVTVRRDEDGLVYLYAITEVEDQHEHS